MLPKYPPVLRNEKLLVIFEELLVIYEDGLVPNEDGLVIFEAGLVPKYPPLLRNEELLVINEAGLVIFEEPLGPNEDELVIWQDVGSSNEAGLVIFEAARLRNAAVLDSKHNGRAGWRVVVAFGFDVGPTRSHRPRLEPVEQDARPAAQGRVVQR